MVNRKKRFISTLILMLMIVLVLMPISAEAASLKVGSRGDTVIEVQKKLKRWGYYDGTVDGIYGPLTQTAVIYFQRKNGLTADGIVGPATAKAMGISLDGTSAGSSSSSSQGSSASSNDLYLLAKVVYGESRGEPYKGQVAVAAVVLNRVESSKFPNSVAGVVYQSGAFSIVADGQINLAPDQTAINAARDAMNGWDPTYGCLYYTIQTRPPTPGC